YLDLDAEAIIEQYDAADESRAAEPAAEPVRQIAIDAGRRPRRAAGAVRRGWLPIAAIAVVAILGIVLVLGLTAGSDKGGDKHATRAGSGPGKESAAGSKPERSSPAPP